MPANRVTLKDIARQIGLSAATISRALADHPDISGETKQRVRDAAQAMSYIPNYRARYLRAKHSQLIALIVPEMNMFFVPSMIAGINRVVQQNDYSLIVFQSDNSIVQERRLAEYASHLSADGVLLVLSSETSDLQHLDVLHDCGIPVALELQARWIVAVWSGAVEPRTTRRGARRRRISWTAATRASSACSATSASASARCVCGDSAVLTRSARSPSATRRSSASR